MKRNVNTATIYISESISYAMENIFRYPITVVEAPMGYGKTTAVREYLKKSDGMVFWQRIYDTSLNHFWKEFCSQFKTLDQECSERLELLGFPDDSASLSRALSLIKNVDFPPKSVWVIDDYHLIDSHSLNRFIELIGTSDFKNLHIVLSTRYIQIQSIEELKLKGYLCHVQKESFELKPQDIMKYYSLCGIMLKSHELEYLYSFTEGWISALYLLMLNYLEEGCFITSVSIYKLVEKSVYLPFSDEIKEFLVCICIFAYFTLEQAMHLWRKGNAQSLLDEITKRNAFIKYDSNTKTYQTHNIFSKYLKNVLDSKENTFKRMLKTRAGQWYVENNDFFSAMEYFYAAKNFDELLKTVEIDKGHCILNEQKDFLIRCMEECPEEIKFRYPRTLLVYAICLFTFNQMELFEKVCGEIIKAVHNNELMDHESREEIMGEFELLLSFTVYNDIFKMSEHHKKAWSLLKKPARFIDTKGGWTFGTPSVLYMFYSNRGKLKDTIEALNEAMPYYYQLTNHHGKGAELVMQAEWYFHRGDFENAEIVVHSAIYSATQYEQSDILMCAMFLKARIELMKGNYENVLSTVQWMHEEMNQKKSYHLLHTMDMCETFLNSSLRRNETILSWIRDGDFQSKRIYFPAMAFCNIVYGRVLLISGEYLKIIGISEQFIGIASVFSNLLGSIYTYIYLGAANLKINRLKEASDAIIKALEIACSDEIYIPFVENCDYIQPLLEEIYDHGEYKADIERILKIYKDYAKIIDKIVLKDSKIEKPKLTERELQIAKMAAQGFTNKEIGKHLYITENTVKMTLKNIFVKLSIKSRALLAQKLEDVG